MVVKVAYSFSTFKSCTLLWASVVFCTSWPKLFPRDMNRYFWKLFSRCCKCIFLPKLDLHVCKTILTWWGTAKEMPMCSSTSICTLPPLSLVFSLHNLRLNLFDVCAHKLNNPPARTNTGGQPGCQMYFSKAHFNILEHTFNKDQLSGTASSLIINTVFTREHELTLKKENEAERSRSSV